MSVRFLLLAILLARMAVQQPETMSLLDEPLYAPGVSKQERANLDAEIAQARGALARDPGDAAAVLALAGAQRRLGRIGDALETLTRAVEGKADTPRLRLERGRGFVAIRKFDLAQKEFRKAAATLPEAHCDTGFALYLLDQYAQATAEYAQCPDPGMFGYLAARRAGDRAAPRPPVAADSPAAAADIRLPGTVAARESHPAASIASQYMDAVDRLLDGRTADAKGLLKPIVERNKTLWLEPVYVAAEADYARVLKAEPNKKKKKRKRGDD